MYENLLAKAILIATTAHIGQKDKGGKPYIFHPLRVMNRVSRVEEKIVAVLHDTLEDTDVTVESLLADGFPKEITDAILGVTHRDGESYDDFVKRAGTNPVSRAVKMADLEDNMDIRRLPYPMKDSDFERLNKYLRSYNYLKELTTGNDR